MHTSTMANPVLDAESLRKLPINHEMVQIGDSKLTNQQVIDYALKCVANTIATQGAKDEDLAAAIMAPPFINELKADCPDLKFAGAVYNVETGMHIGHPKSPQAGHELKTFLGRLGRCLRKVRDELTGDPNLQVLEFEMPPGYEGTEMVVSMRRVFANYRNLVPAIEVVRVGYNQELGGFDGHCKTVHILRKGYRRRAQSVTVYLDTENGLFLGYHAGAYYYANHAHGSDKAPRHFNLLDTPVYFLGIKTNAVHPLDQGQDAVAPRINGEDGPADRPNNRHMTAKQRKRQRYFENRKNRQRNQQGRQPAANAQVLPENSSALIAAIAVEVAKRMAPAPAPIMPQSLGAMVNENKGEE